MFAVNVAADINASKENLELAFPSCPSVGELTREVERVYTALLRNQDVEASPFEVVRLQIYHDQTWSDLSDPSQLHPHCQVYAFQKDWFKEVQSHIPPARPVPPDLGGSLRGAGSGWVVPADPRETSRGRPSTPPPSRSTPPLRPHPPNSQPPCQHPVLPDFATHAEKAAALFDQLDVKNIRGIEPADLRHGFQLLEVPFAVHTIDDLFSKADRNKDSVISYQEWVVFMESYPTLLDSLYLRCKAHWDDERRRHEIQTAYNELHHLQEKEKESNVRWIQSRKDVESETQRLMKQKDALEAAAAAQAAADASLAQSERDLEAAREALKDAETAYKLVKDRMLSQESSHEAASASRAEAESRLRECKKEAVQAASNEHKAQMIVEEASRDVDAQRTVCKNLRHEASLAAEKEHAAKMEVADTVRNIQEIEASIAALGREVEDRCFQDKHNQGLVQKAGALIHARAAELEAVQQDVEAARKEEQEVLARKHEAERVSEEAAQRVAQLERDNEMFEEQRRLAEMQESPILEQEIRLREQRNRLEENEAKLRAEHHAFYTAAVKPPSP